MVASPARDEDFDIEIEGVGTINGVAFDARGNGIGNAGTGRLSFSVEFSAIPDGTDPFAGVLGVLIIGTTVFGRELGDAYSLMTLADGEFEFTQMVAGPRIEVGGFGAVTRSSDRGFHWTSTADGTVDLRGVTSIEPFDAVMLPQGPGKLVDVLEFPVVAQTERHHVHVVRHFSFTPRAELPTIQLRAVEIKPTIEGRRVSVDIASEIRTMVNRVPERRGRS
jgi:hypothetical protein